MIINGKWMSEPEIAALISQLIVDNNRLEKRMEQSAIKGEWIKGKGFWNKNTVQCSLCGNYLDMDGVNGGRGDANFCPNCGADMRGTDDVQQI